MTHQLSKFGYGLFLSLFLWLILFAPTPVYATSNSSEIKLIQLINAQRQSQGLSTLNISSLLTTAAQNHSSTMANCAKHSDISTCFSHQVSQVSESSTWDRISAIGYQPQATAENIAWGQTTAQAVLDSWMNSSGHKANILGSNYQDIGCGFLDNNNGNYDGMFWTCDFGKSSSPRPTNSPTPTSTKAPHLSPSPKPTHTSSPSATPTASPTINPTSLPSFTSRPNPSSPHNFNPTPKPTAAPAPIASNIPPLWWCFNISKTEFCF